MGKRLRRILLMLFVVWFTGALILDTWGKTREASGKYDAIIVAGCRVYPDGKPSPALEWRVRKSLQMWQQGMAGRVVFTGGLGDFPPTEAEASARLAAELGMPREVMVLEDRSTSTQENARNAAQSFPGAQTMRVLVVTDAYHVFRARRIFAQHFGTVDAVGSTYGVWSRIRGSFREVLALVKFSLLN